jgi:carboxypeptidase PM20D1
MKNILKFLAVALVLLVGVLLFNTLKLTSKQLMGIAPAPPLIVSDSAIGHLSKAIQFRTVSNSDATQIDSAQFEQFVAFLKQTYPLAHSRLTYQRISSYSLLFEWKGKNPALKPAMLMGHYDVVPVIQGTERLWQHKPFDGEIADGFVYGRGSLDDKTTVIGLLEAVEYLLQQGYQPERTTFLAFGHDEEVGGHQGGKKIVELLESRKMAFEYVLDEGAAIKVEGLSGIQKPVALIGIAEKGSMTLQLTATGEGGHSSMPPAKTSIGELATAIDKLQNHPFPASMNGAVGQMQDYLAPEMPFFKKMLMANRWLFGSFLIKTMSKTNVGNATVRTTIAPTILEAGVKENVLPIDAVAKVNFRILPGDSIGYVADFVKKAIENDSIKVEYNAETARNPTFVSDTASFGFRLIHTTIKRCFPDVIVTPSLVVAGTDSRYYSSITRCIYRFMPYRLTDEDLKRPHGTNERISTNDLKNAVRFYVEMIKSDK